MQDEKMKLRRELQIANQTIAALRELVEAQKLCLALNRDRAETYRSLLGISSKTQNHNPILRVVRH